MKKKLKIVHDCQVGSCYNARNIDECYGVHICDMCKLCTSDGMVVKKVKHEDIIYKVEGVSEDEIILYAPEYKRLCSISPDLNKFIKIFEIVETEYDDRRYW